MQVVLVDNGDHSSELYNPPIVDVPRGEDLTAENGPLLSCQTSWRNVKWNN